MLLDHSGSDQRYDCSLSFTVQPLLPKRAQVFNGKVMTDDPIASVHFLGLATHLATSTLVCAFELWKMDDWPQDEISKTMPGYIGFSVICTSTFLFTHLIYSLSLNNHVSLCSCGHMARHVCQNKGELARKGETSLRRVLP